MAKQRSANPDQQLKQALYALQQGQFRQALRRLEKLLPLARPDPVLGEQAHLALADAHLSLRQLPQAIEHADLPIIPAWRRLEASSILINLCLRS